MYEIVRNIVLGWIANGMVSRQDGNVVLHYIEQNRKNRRN